MRMRKKELEHQKHSNAPVHEAKDLPDWKGEDGESDDEGRQVTGDDKAWSNDVSKLDDNISGTSAWASAPKASSGWPSDVANNQPSGWYDTLRVWRKSHLTFKCFTLHLQVGSACHFSHFPECMVSFDSAILFGVVNNDSHKLIGLAF